MRQQPHAQFWLGRVEDREDPMNLGRVKVRIVGYHSDDQSLIPTNDLPWATILMPPTTAALSGVGESPNGLMIGSLVFGTFLDGNDCQMPLVMGSINQIECFDGPSEDCAPWSSPSPSDPSSPSTPSRPLGEGEDIGNWLMNNLQRDFGLTDFQAAAFVGNLHHESAGFQIMQEVDPVSGGEGGWGIAQWTGVRRQEFESFADSRGAAYDDLNVQYEFLSTELRGDSQSGLPNNNFMTNLRNSTNLRDATVTAERDFFHPHAAHRHTNRRLDAAQQYLANADGDSDFEPEDRPRQPQRQPASTTGCPTRSGSIFNHQENTITDNHAHGAPGNHNPVGDGPHWLQIARGELGVKEASGGQNNPRIIEYHKAAGLNKGDETPWCASFISWVMQQAGYSFSSASARAWANFGQPVDTPQLGDIVVLSRGSNPAYGHVGFYLGTEGGRYKLLGGNQGSGEVNISHFSTGRLVAIRRPSGGGGGGTTTA